MFCSIETICACISPYHGRRFLSRLSSLDGSCSTSRALASRLASHPPSWGWARLHLRPAFPAPLLFTCGCASLSCKAFVYYGGPFIASPPLAPPAPRRGRGSGPLGMNSPASGLYAVPPGPGLSAASGRTLLARTPIRDCTPPRTLVLAVATALYTATAAQVAVLGGRGSREVDVRERCGHTVWSWRSALGSGLSSGRGVGSMGRRHTAHAC